MARAVSAAGRVLRLWALARALSSRVRIDSLLRNSIYIMAATVATSALGYVYWTVAARTYSRAEVGLAAALLSAMTLASSISNLGIGSALVQTLPRRASGREWSATLNAGLCIGALSGLLCGAVVTLLLPLVSPQFSIVGHTALGAGALIIGVPLWTLGTLQDCVFQAERAAGNMLTRNLIFAVTKIPLLALPLVIPGLGAMGIVLSWVLGSIAAGTWALLVAIPRLRRGYAPSLHGVGRQARAMLSSLAGHHVINLGGMAPMYVLPLLVTARLSAADNAYFYTTWMVSNLFFMVSPSVAASLFAEGSHVDADVARKARASALLIAALLAPVMVVFVVFGRALLGIFGPGYANRGFALLMILMAAAIPDAATNVYVSVLRVRRHLRLGALLNAGMAALCIALAWVLLPILGIAGAGVAWFCGQAAGSIWVAVHVRATRGETRVDRPAIARGA